MSNYYNPQSRKILIDRHSEYFISLDTYKNCFIAPVEQSGEMDIKRFFKWSIYFRFLQFLQATTEGWFLRLNSRKPVQAQKKPLSKNFGF